jgi:hypothetical protein
VNRQLKLQIIVVTMGLLLALALPAQGSPALPTQAGDEAVAHTHGPDGLQLDGHGATPSAEVYAVDERPAWNASEYDGAVNARDVADLTTLPTFHAVYMYPTDKPSRFAEFAAMFQADAKQANDRLGAMYGRGVRFDYRAGGFLDISVVKSKANSKKIGSGNQFSVVSTELTNAGFTNPNKKYVVWLDAGSNYCGQGTLYQDTRRSAANYNERRSVAIVYRPYATTNGEGGFCRGRVLLHEMGHNMGALQQVAPNAFDGAHCDDDNEDVMCYTSAATFDSGSLPQFDYNNDDYWDGIADSTEPFAPATKLSWWAVNLSKFVCPVAGCSSPNNPEY